MTDGMVDLLLKFGFTSYLMALTYSLANGIMPSCKEWLQHISIFTFIMAGINLCFMSEPEFISQNVKRLPISPVITYGALFIVIVLSFFMHWHMYKFMISSMQIECGEDMLEYYEVNSSDKVSDYKSMKYYFYKKFCDLHGIMAIAYICTMYMWITFSALGIVGIIGFLAHHISF